MIRRILGFLILSMLVLSTQPQIMLAQDAVAATVQCGSIVESELIENGQDDHGYTIQVAPGDILNLRLEPVGDTLNLMLYVLSPVGEHLNLTSVEGYSSSMLDFAGDGQSEEGSTPAVSARGIYTIGVQGYRSNDIGVYTLYIGCTLRDGTLILPGELPSTSLDENDSSSPVGLAPIFSGVGFPGLAPVDFSNVAKLPLPAGIAMSGGITPTGGEILGYLMDANAGDVLDLTFIRLSGNLNVGLVVLSSSNQVVFQTSLVTASTLIARFTLPSAGQYTIGVFRIDLLPPAAPEATAFQITATLNPA